MARTVRPPKAPDPAGGKGTIPPSGSGKGTGKLGSIPGRPMGGLKPPKGKPKGPPPGTGGKSMPSFPGGRSFGKVGSSPIGGKPKAGPKPTPGPKKAR